MTEIRINGWAVLLHPCFLDQYEALVLEVETARAKDPDGYRKRACMKMLAAVNTLAFNRIPADPADPVYRQGDTLGPGRSHWFRAKFFQQYRLFFRFQESARIIIIAWVNDDDSKRAYGSRTDAYKVFGRMLKTGNPPDDWAALVADARAASTRTEKALSAAGELL